MKQLRESDSDVFNVGTDEATDEFVLSAQDLLELSRPGAIQGPTPDAAKWGAGSPVEAPVSSQAQTAGKQGEAPSRDGRLSIRRIGLSLSIMIAVVGTGIVLYLYSRPEGAVGSAMGMTPPAAAPVALATPLESEQVPVRFANPFDHTEVFEFPEGTTETEAREAVADILKERAQDRKHQRNARSAGNRRTDAASRLVSSPGHDNQTPETRAQR